MFKKILAGWVVGMGITAAATAQDIKTFMRAELDTLCGNTFSGRGYVDSGMWKAADFLASRFDKMGLKPVGNDWFQRFEYPANSFPGQLTLQVNGKVLQPGVDYIVWPSSRNYAGSYDLDVIDSSVVADSARLVQRFRMAFSNRKAALVYLPDSVGYLPFHKKFFADSTLKGMVLVATGKKLIWTPSKMVPKNLAAFTVLRKSLPENPVNGSFLIQQKFMPSFVARNVVGMIPGKRTDSCVVITAHYDHLGRMGRQALFPGAMDNASGTSMLLWLAHYYSKHEPPCNIVFMLFAGEEAGLLGSKYYTEHPMFPLSQIKFLLNIDMMGDATDGISVINGKEIPARYQLLKQLSDEKYHFKEVREGGKASNSDHHWFYEKGVPAFFIFGIGGQGHYHDVYDKPETVSLNNMDKVADMILNFIDKL